METELLATKLFVPQPRPGLVPRRRLIESLQSALSSPFTLISAPAGFGKTTLIAQWITANSSQIPVTWLQIDETDNDPVRFWDYFIASLKTLRPTTGESASKILHSAETYTIEKFLTSLINDIASLPAEFVLVIDDFHLVKSADIHTGITFLIDHCPPSMHLIMATRIDPVLPLSRFRGRGVMIEIGAYDLRFTEQEVGDLIKKQNVELIPEDIRALFVKTEGWVAGLKMATVAMRGTKDAHQFVALFAGSQRYIMDYLLEEVLKRQPPELSLFLLTTSILEKMNASICDYLSGNVNGGEMLLKLEQSNLFLVPLDDNGLWYRYHHLFSELLHHQLEVMYTESEIRELHRRAAEWYKSHNFIDDAVHHALAAQNWEWAVSLVKEVAENRINRGERSTLLGWLESIPDEELRKQHRLYSQYANTLAGFGRYEKAQAALSYLEKSVKDDPNLLGEVAVSQTTLAFRQGDSERVTELTIKALSLLSKDNITMRARANFTLGYIQYEKGIFNESSSLLSQAYELGLQSGDIWIASGALNFMAATTHQCGKLGEALGIANRAVELSGQLPGAAVAWCRVCIIQYELNYLEAAVHSARQVVDLSELNTNARVVGYLYMAKTRLAQGDSAGAIEAMNKMDKAGQDRLTYASFKARQVAGRVIFAIQQKDLEAATEWGGKLTEYLNVLPIECQHIPARLLIAQGKKQEAAGQLKILHQKMLQAGAIGLTIGVQVCRALTAITENEALVFLTDALQHGESEKYIRTFVDEGELLEPLLRKILRNGMTTQYITKLLNIIEVEKRQRLFDGEKLPSKKTELLSKREIEILKLIEAGLSNRQIAERLLISSNTTKSHLSNIFQKLNAKTRTQALTYAREIKLI
jgi:LuxR family transcriptional regulator, maltose regulon positive regulatory protein